MFNAMAAVSARGHATTSIIGNTIRDGRASGVHVSEAARATLEENEVRRNKLCGVEVEGQDASLIARRNKLEKNGGGAWAGAEGAVMEGNSVA